MSPELGDDHDEATPVLKSRQTTPELGLLRRKRRGSQ